MKELTDFVQALATIEKYRTSGNPLEQLAVNDVIEKSNSRFNSATHSIDSFQSELSYLGAQDQLKVLVDYASSFLKSKEALSKLSQYGVSLRRTPSPKKTDKEHDLIDPIKINFHYVKDEKQICPFELFKSIVKKFELPEYLQEVLEDFGAKNQFYNSSIINTKDLSLRIETKLRQDVDEEKLSSPLNLLLDLGLLKKAGSFYRLCDLNPKSQPNILGTPARDMMQELYKMAKYQGLSEQQVKRREILDSFFP